MQDQGHPLVSAMSIVNWFTRRYERRALVRRNLAYYLWRFVGNGARVRLRRATPPTHADAAGIARDLLTQGISVASSSRFLSEAGARALAEASSGIVDLSRTDEVQAIVAARHTTHGKKEFLVNLVRAQGRLPATHPLLAVALDVKLLEIVASYLGLWPCLHSVAAWLNYPTDSAAETSQLWHRDPEDLTIIKVFIYLQEVGDEQGPFTYIPKTHPFGSLAPQALACRAKRIDDERMRRFFAPERWQVCTGPAGTMILADTVGFHRGGKPATGTRLLVTFTYTSGTPFVGRPLRVDGMPSWISTDIQRCAIEPAVRDYAARAPAGGRPAIVEPRTA